MSMNNVENLPPHVLRLIAKETSELQSNAPEGIVLSINEEDITDIQATILGPVGTPYAGGHFRVKLSIGRNFPAEPPKAHFLTKIFHPNVAPSGEICVNTLKKDWKAEYGLKHILLTIKCLLIVPNPESALNEEAGKLLLDHYEIYSSRARLYTDIHAKPLASTKVGAIKLDTSEPTMKKHAFDSTNSNTAPADKKNSKKVLKRL